MLRTPTRKTQIGRLFVVIAGSSLLVASSCKSRTFNKLIGNESSDDSNRPNQGSSPDGCAKLKPGSRIAISEKPEIRVRDAYQPMSLVQSERRYVISLATKTVQIEETPVGDNCCEARTNDSLVAKSLSTEQVTEIQSALSALTLATDLRCATEPAVKALIDKAKCDTQAGHTVLLDEGRVLPDSHSCVPTTQGLWGQANGLADVVKILRTLTP